MREPGDGLDLASEASTTGVEVQELGAQHLERDFALRAGLHASVDDAHAALAESFENAMSADVCEVEPTCDVYEAALAQ